MKGMISSPKLDYFYVQDNFRSLRQT